MLQPLFGMTTMACLGNGTGTHTFLCKDENGWVLGGVGSGWVGSGRVDIREPISDLGPGCMTRARDMYENEPLLARLTKDMDPTLFFFSSLRVTKKIIIEKKETRKENINKKEEWYKSLVP